MARTRHPRSTKKNPTRLHLKNDKSKWNDIKIERKIVSEILKRVGLFANTDKDKNLNQCLIEMEQSSGFLRVSKSTMRRHYLYYQQYGELPSEGRKRYYVSRTDKWEQDQIEYLKKIINHFPQYYLDEISDVFHAKFSKVEWKKSDNDIWRCIHNKCNYRLKVYTEIALQRDEQERNHFRYALKLMTTNADQILLIDETNRDKNAARRRRMWALRGQRAEMRKKFDVSEDDDYCMIASGDITGLIPDACELVFKGDNNINVARGTIDGDRFLDYVRYFIVPCVGNFLKDEPRSIVIMDNASIHNKEEIKRLINEAGGMLLYTARYSPDINPIEYYFHQYKSSLKRVRGDVSAIERHQMCINCVSKKDAINTYKHCGFPCLPAIDEEDDDAAAIVAVLALLSE